MKRPDTTLHPVLAPLLLAVVVGLLGRADARELELNGETQAGVTGDDAPVPPIKFWHPLPSYYTISSNVVVPLLVGYAFREGVVAAVFFSLVEWLIFAWAYYIASIATDADPVMWSYGVFNYEPLLANRGAVGGFFWGIGYFGVVIFFGYLGDMCSWSKIDVQHGGKKTGEYDVVAVRQRTYKQFSLKSFFGRGCSRFLCPQSLNDEATLEGKGEGGVERFLGDPDAQWKSVGVKPGSSSRPEAMDGTTDAARGVTESTFTNSCVAYAPTHEVTWASFHDFFLLLAICRLAVAAGRDIWTVGSLDWVGLGLLVLGFAIILMTYPMYRPGERIDYSPDRGTAAVQIQHQRMLGTEAPARLEDEEQLRMANDNERRVYVRHFNKLEWLTWPFLHCFLAMLGVSILYTVQDVEGAWRRRLIFSADAYEMKYFAKQNLGLELFTLAIIGVTLMLVGYGVYIAVVKSKTPVFGPVVPKRT